MHPALDVVLRAAAEDPKAVTAASPYFKNLPTPAVENDAAGLGEASRRLLEWLKAGPGVAELKKVRSREGALAVVESLCSVAVKVKTAPKLVARVVAEQLADWTSLSFEPPQLTKVPRGAPLWVDNGCPSILPDGSEVRHKVWAVPMVEVPPDPLMLRVRASVENRVRALASRDRKRKETLARLAREEAALIEAERRKVAARAARRELWKMAKVKRMMWWEEENRLSYWDERVDRMEQTRAAQRAKNAGLARHEANRCAVKKSPPFQRQSSRTRFSRRRFVPRAATLIW